MTAYVPARAPAPAPARALASSLGDTRVMIARSLRRSFRDPEEFLISLRSAEVLRRPKSLAYLQSLKWVAQVKEKVR